VTEKGGEARLVVESVTMEFTSAPYALVTVTHNPGRWPAGLSLMLLMAGVVGTVIWPAHRFWLREEKASVLGAGPVPTWLSEGDS
jgi:hypothetical protein